MGEPEEGQVPLPWLAEVLREGENGGPPPGTPGPKGEGLRLPGLWGRGDPEAGTSGSWGGVWRPGVLEEERARGWSI